MTNRDALLSAVCLLCLTVPASAQVAGVTAAVNQSATGVPPSGTIRTVVLGDNVVRDERIDTNSIGLVQILLADGTAFTVGPDSSVTIDSFVYDPDAGTAQVAATMTRGVLRFIGGRTSKTPNGVSLATPIGTVGIRGAVVDVNLVGSTADSCGLPAHIDLVFGQEVTLSGGGAPARVYQPGYSIVADGRQGRRVQRTPPGCASLVQSALAGRPGTTGGASEPPTETVVAQSPIGAENSARPVFVNAPPIPTARPVNPNTVDAILVADATLDLVRIRVAQGLPPVAPEPPVMEPEPEPPVVEPPVVEPPVEPEPEPPVVEQPVEPEPEPEPPVVEPEPPVVPPVEPPVDPEETVTFNVYQNDPESPPELGLVSDQPTSTTAAASDSRLTGTLDGTPATAYDLPAYTDAQDDSEGAALDSFFVSSFSSGGTIDTASYGGAPLVGDVYVGSEGFRAYLLRTAQGEGGSGGFMPLAVAPPALFYAIAGTATPVSVFLEPEVRQYRIDDGGASELFAPPSNAFGPASNLYVVGGNTPRILQADLTVFGEGESSEINVNVGRLVSVQSNGGWAVQGEQRGGARAPDNPETAVEGSFASLNNEQDFGFFGTDGDYAVLSGTPGNPEPFVETPRDPGSDGTARSPYNDTHVLSRAGEDVPISETRSGGEFIGYAAGAVTTGRQDGTSARELISSQSLYRDTDGEFFSPNVSLLLDASDNTVEGFIGIPSRETEQTPSTASVDVTVGAESAFVDDDRYAAVGANASYVLSGRADPISFDSELASNDLCSACDFIQWGWWGMQTEEEVNVDEGTTLAERQGVHLGSYVVGNVTSVSEYNSAIESENVFALATYGGNAVGTVIENGATRVATGQFSMTWNFAGREGDIDMTFGGRDFTAPLGQSSDGTAAAFVGNGVALNGQETVAGDFDVRGAFVTGPIGPLDGVIGNFDAIAPGWSGTGVFGGARGPDVEVPSS